MRVADLLVAALLMLLGGVVLFDAVRLRFGWGLEGPQSGFFPFWLASCLVAVALGIFVQALIRRSPTPFASLERIVPVLKVLLPVAAFVILTDPPGPPSGFGLYVAGALYLGFYMRWVGRHTWPAVLGLSVLVPVVTFVLFEKWFLVPMPKGPVEAWLGY